MYLKCKHSKWMHIICTIHDLWLNTCMYVCELFGCVCISSYKFEHKSLLIDTSRAHTHIFIPLEFECVCACARERIQWYFHVFLLSLTAEKTEHANRTTSIALVLRREKNEMKTFYAEFLSFHIGIVDFGILFHFILKFQTWIFSIKVIQRYKKRDLYIGQWQRCKQNKNRPLQPF